MIIGSYDRWQYVTDLCPLYVAPQPPTNLQTGTILPKSATCTWSTLTPNRPTPWATVFNYRVVLIEYVFGLPRFTANTSVESYTFTALEEFNNYTVIVAAQNTIGLSEYSFTLNFSTPQAGMTIIIITYYVVSYGLLKLNPNPGSI